MAEYETPDEPVMTHIGGGRSAVGVAVAFVMLLAGGWLLLVLGGGRDESAAASPSATLGGAANASAPPTATPAASAAATPVGPTTSPAPPPQASAEQLVVSFVTGERRYDIPLRMAEPGTFHGGTSLAYPLGLGATVELAQVTDGADGSRATRAGTWQAVFYSAGGPDREVSILEYAQQPRTASRDLPAVLRHGYQLVVTADGGHYPQLTVRLSIPYGLRLSRPGACEGGWRFSHPDERC